VQKYDRPAVAVDLRVELGPSHLIVAVSATGAVRTRSHGGEHGGHTENGTCEETYDL